MKAYSEYKDFGVEWLGKIPAHWVSRRLCNVTNILVSNVDKHIKKNEHPVRLCNYVDVYKTNALKSTMNFMRATATKDEIKKFRLLQNDVVITKDSEDWEDIGVPAFIEDESPDWICGYHLAILRAKSQQLIARYLNWCIQGKSVALQFSINANGVTRYGLSYGGIKNVFIPLPPLSKQTQIARYLDWKTAKINSFIRNKRRMIELLKEQKQSIINQAVTRGLDPNVKLKPSGVEWLGDVPEGWEVLAVRRCAKTVKTGSTPTGAGDEHFSSTGFNWFTPGDFKDELYLAASERQLSEVGIQNVKIFPSNTIMMIGIGATIGKVAISKEYASCNQQINGIVANNRMDVEYFALSLRSLREYIVSCGKFTTIPIINQDETKSLSIQVPPIPEQRKIVDHIFSQVATIDLTITRAQREIDLIQEYRTRLIADVVTGKIDVRGVVVPEGMEDEAQEDEEIKEAMENMNSSKEDVE